jgi:hypothetical protein
MIVFRLPRERKLRAPYRSTAMSTENEAGSINCALIKPLSYL